MNGLQYRENVLGITEDGAGGWETVEREVPSAFRATEGRGVPSEIPRESGQKRNENKQNENRKTENRKDVVKCRRRKIF